VFFKATLVHIVLVAPVKDALEVASSSFPLVDLEVLLEIRTRGELLTTLDALEWLVT
jgi:hypothetical protein